MKTEKIPNFRILAVDDEEPILRLYQRILGLQKGAREGSPAGPSFELSVCRQGDEALAATQKAIAQNAPFAVVFLDFNMPPGPDGMWTAEQIRKLDAQASIIVVTGHAQVDFKSIAQRVPPPDKLLYLQKPFHHQEILQFATALSTKWSSEQELHAIQTKLQGMVANRTSQLKDANMKLRTEIKQRINTEKSLRESEKKFRNIICSNADAIVILDSKGVVHFTNPAAEKLFGSKPADMVGRPFGFPMVYGERSELDYVRADGTPGTIEMRTAESEWEKKKVYMASMRDTTDRRLMEEKVRRSLMDLQKTMKETIEAMALTVETRDPYTAGHQQRVANLALAIAHEMGLPKERTEGLYLAGVIHDLGKLSIPSDLLSKPTRLSEIEFSLMKTHSQAGYDIVKGIAFPWPIADIILQHHERINGTGYPQGLKGDEILLEAKIMSVADVVEAMGSHRPYRPALGVDIALEEIVKNRGSGFDPAAVDACVKLFREKGYELK